MNEIEGYLLKLAAAVADAEAVDWDSVTQATQTSEMAVLHELRALSELVAVHRSVPPAVGPSELPVGERTWGSFEIRRVIGRGAFATVYLAWDTSLECEVALKLLPVQPGVEASSVLREGRLLARVNHPNVVRVYRIEQHDDAVGLSMEFIEGVTLKRLLHDHGTQTVEEASRICIDLCAAVAAVHRAGLLHRDIKTQNVMRAVGGRIVLMDFGGGGDFMDDRASYAQTLQGTPLYLAPEILNGGSASVAGDIYSLGVLLYSLVTQRFPVLGASLGDLQRAHAQGEVTPLAQLRTDLPPAFLDVVATALHPDPASRFRSAAAMRDALLRAIDYQEVLRAPDGAARISGLDLPSVAVLPFVNVHQDPEIEYLCDGLAEEILAALGTIGGLRVVSRTSSFQFKGRHVDVRTLGRQLKAATLLEGTVTRRGDQLRIRARHVHVADDFVLWSETYEHNMDDVLAVQDEIAARVAERFKLSSGQLAEHAGSRRATDNPLAYQLYWQGRYYWSQRYQGRLLTALDFFQRAIDADAAYSLAHAGVADVFSFLGLYSFQRPREAFALAAKAAQRALAIDPASPEVQTSLALVALGDWNVPVAIRHLERAVALDHSLVIPRIYHAWSLALLGEVSAAIEMANSARELDPRSVLVDSGLAYTRFLLKQYEAGVAACNLALEREPDLVIAMYVKGMCRAQQGHFDEAIALLERSAKMSNRAPFYVGLLGNFYARAQRTEEAKAVLAELYDRAANGNREDPTARDGPRVYVPPHAFAYVYAGLGDLDAAFEWQGRACDDQASPFNYFSPVIECMHGDPRHDADLRRMGWRQWAEGHPSG